MATPLDEYLIKLGFDVDERQKEKFKTAVREGSFQAQVLFEALKGMVKAFHDTMTQFSEGLDDLYWASKRFGDSAGNILAYEQAAKRVGISAKDAEAAIKSFAISLNNPGLNNLAASISGVSAAQWGKLTTTQKMNDFFAALRKMQPIIAQQYLALYNTDYETFLGLSDPEHTKGLERAAEIAKRFGFDAKEAAKNGHDLVVTLNELGNVLYDLGAKAAQPILTWYTAQLKDLDKYLEDHSGDIKEAFDDIGSGIKSLDDFLKQLGTPDITSGLDSTRQDLENIANLFKTISGWLDKISKSEAFKRWFDAGKTIGMPFVGQWSALHLLAQIPGPVGAAASAAEAAQNLMGGAPGAGNNVPAAPPQAQENGSGGLWHNFSGWLDNKWANRPGWLGGGSANQSQGGTQASAPSQGTSSPAHGTLGTNQQEAYRAARAEGLSDNAARALVANFSGESLRNPANTSGDSGSAQGIGQWHGDRAEAIHRQFGKYPHDMTVAEQTRAALWEMKNNPAYARSWNSLNSGNSADQMVSTLVRNYERPANPGRDINTRLGYLRGFSPRANTESASASWPWSWGIISPAQAAEATRRHSPFGDMSGAYGAFGINPYPPASSPVSNDNSKHSELHQKTTINVFAGENEEVGSTVSRHQASVNANLARNFAGSAVG